MNKKDDKDKKGHLSIQMNEKLNEYLDEFVKNNGLKKSRLIEELLKKYIDSKSIQFPTIEEILDESWSCGADEVWARTCFKNGAQWTIDYIKKKQNKSDE